MIKTHTNQSGTVYVSIPVSASTLEEWIAIAERQNHTTCVARIAAGGECNCTDPDVLTDWIITTCDDACPSPLDSVDVAAIARRFKSARKPTKARTRKGSSR